MLSRTVNFFFTDFLVVAPTDAISRQELAADEGLDDVEIALRSCG